MSPLATRASAAETGDSRFSVRIETSNHSFIGDEPVEAGGLGLGPNPFEMLAAALAECTTMTIRWFAMQRNWPVGHVEVVVEHRKTVPVGSAVAVDVFEKTISIDAPALSIEQKSRLLEIAGKCPVQRILEGTPLVRTKS